MNYYLIGQAIEYYKSIGYTWINTPWAVPLEDLSLTFPGHREKCELGYLVGSAEQGFINLMRTQRLAAGKYVSAGPCFRFEDNQPPYKLPYFFKVELCKVGSGIYTDLLRDSLSFLGGEVVETSIGHDIELNGLEIGSYGNRNINGLVWAYGTGIAEPRYSQAKALTK
jgi:hypothetical protein